mgnify:CR=1 FL=1|jgi:type II secretory pathway pseudopilin PulG|tara:strand:- start:99 stop:602 length:504 start_codon:yes stop_codon:yes gene_type:complete
MGLSRKNAQTGFTVIELLVVGTVLAIAGVLVYVQVNNLQSANEDFQRKTAINAMHYALEEVYYKEHQAYPASLNAATLPSVDPDLFTDPDGFTLGKDVLSEEELKALLEDGDADQNTQKRLDSVSMGKSPNYHYDATDCDMKGKCQSYTLRADLTHEADYVKESRHE